MSALYASLAQAFLPAWGFYGAAELRLLNLSENATFRVSDGKRTAILRVHREGYHELAGIESELSWAAAVRTELGLSTPTVILTRAGERVATARDEAGHERFAVLFEPLPGREPPPDDLQEWLPLLGSIAARLHLQAQTWCPPGGFTRFRWDIDDILGTQPRWGRWQDGLGVTPVVREILGRAAAEIAARLRDYGNDPSRFGLVHADMRLANLLVDGAEVSVIDFDDSGFCWYLFDLAATLSFVEHDRRVPAWCAAWLRGYRQIRPLDAAELELVPTFVMLRRLMLVAWLGSHHFTELAHELGTEYTEQTCALAEHYVAGTGWAQQVLEAVAQQSAVDLAAR